MQKSKQPVHALLLLTYIFLMLGGVMFLFPNKIPFIGESKDSMIPDSLSFFTYKDVFIPKKVEKKDISDITNVFAQLDEMSDLAELEDSLDSYDDDSIVETSIKPRRVKLEDVLDRKYHIQFPDSSLDALSAIFAHLEKTNDSSALIRMIHYGDSQLEGDRITSHLRKRMQKRFGGCGPGLLPIVESVGARATIRQKYADNWIKYQIYGKNYHSNSPHNYSLLGSYFGYEPLGDSISLVGADSIEYHDTSWVTYLRPYRNYQKEFKFETLKLYYGEIKDSTHIFVEIPKDTLIEKEIPKSRKFGHFDFNLNIDDKFEELKIRFEGKDQAQLYGVALDCEHGLAVDNVGMRGSSGTEFLRMDKAFLAKQIKELNVKFLILQFGVNVVPYENEDYNWYKNSFTKQLKMLKSLSPDLSILVIGVSDMSKKVDEYYESYPNIELIRDAQKEAAFNAGCAFWDLYEAMGGKNSMVSWVNADPPLAGSDYTHFNFRGAKMVGELLFNALMLEYELYTSSNQNEKKK